MEPAELFRRLGRSLGNPRGEDAQAFVWVAGFGAEDFEPLPAAVGAVPGAERTLVQPMVGDDLRRSESWRDLCNFYCQQRNVLLACMHIAISQRPLNHRPRKRNLDCP